MEQCTRNVATSKFEPVGERQFVQIFNTGDHWICVITKFTSSSDEINIYDSLKPTAVSQSLAMQKSSLMRNHRLKDDRLTFNLRKFEQLSGRTRLCGFYAVAAMYSCCNNVDLYWLRVGRIRAD
jgi:hypothetical protein